MISVTVTNENSGFSKVVISPAPVWLGSGVFTPEWATILNKPSTFPPSAHTHPASQITDFATAVAAAAPPTTNAGLLTSGTLLDARLSTAVTTSLGKADTASQPGHLHVISDVANLQTTLDGKQASGSYAASSHSHPASQITDFATAVVAVAPPANLNYQSAIADAVVSTQVGGATPQPASTWKTLTLSQSLDTILFPTVPPFISTQKSATLTVSGATGVQEVGSSDVRTATATFNQGRITDGNGSLGPLLVGGAGIFFYTGPATTSTTGSFGSKAVVLGSNQWSVIINHLVGSGAYFDNKGNASTALDGSRSAGTVTASTTAFTGVYPWYHLKSPVTFTAAQFAAAITAGNATNIHASAVLTKVIADASGTISIPYNVSNQFVGAAYEENGTTKTQYYVTALDNGAITAVFNAVVTQNNVTTALWVRNYKMHISTNPLTNSNPTLELRNS